MKCLNCGRETGSRYKVLCAECWKAEHADSASDLSAEVRV